MTPPTRAEIEQRLYAELTNGCLDSLETHQGIGILHALCWVLTGRTCLNTMVGIRMSIGIFTLDPRPWAVVLGWKLTAAPDLTAGPEQMRYGVVAPWEPGGERGYEL